MDILQRIDELEQKLCKLAQSDAGSINDIHFANTDLTATENRLHTWAGFNLTIQGIREYLITADDNNGAGKLSLKHLGGNGDVKDNGLQITAGDVKIGYYKPSTGEQTAITFKSDTTLSLDSSEGLYEMLHLKGNALVDRLIGQVSSNGRLNYITIGSGLSLTGGVLTASGGGGAGTDTNFATTDLTATAHRVHNFGSFDLTFSAIRGFRVNANNASSQVGFYLSKSKLELNPSDLILSVINGTDSNGYTASLTQAQLATLQAATGAIVRTYIDGDNKPSVELRARNSATLGDGIYLRMHYNAVTLDMLNAVNPFKINNLPFGVTADDRLVIDATNTVKRLASSTPVVNSGAISLGSADVYVFNGVTATWLLPPISTSIGKRYYIKNRGSGQLTLSRVGADSIYDTAIVTSFILNAGSAIIMQNDGVLWDVM